MSQSARRFPLLTATLSAENGTDTPLLSLSPPSCPSISPLTNLKSRTLFGRPNFKQIFSTITTAVESGSYLVGREAALNSKVGVYFCGPAMLAKTIKETCLAAASKNVKYSFAKEHF